MKTISQLNNEEKARLLVDLFPEMKPLILDKVEFIANYIVNNQAELLESWRNPLVSFYEWKLIVEEILKVIKRARKDMLRSNRQFCYLLFLGYRGIYVVDCILKVAQSGQHDKRFTAIAYALFNVEQCYDIVECDISAEQ